MARVGSYWGWLGHRLRLSQPGRVFFTVALLVGVAEIVVARAHGDREGGALVVLTLLLIGVITLDAVGRGVVALFVVSSWTVGSGVIPEHWRSAASSYQQSPSGPGLRWGAVVQPPGAHGFCAGDQANTVSCPRGFWVRFRCPLPSAFMT